MRTEVQKVAWRSYWPTTLLAVTFLLVAGIVFNYLTARQHFADARAEKQRQAICAILANIPGHIPPEIARARGVFARPGHPGDCQPIPRPAPKATPAPTPHPTVTVTIQPTPMAAASPAPRSSSNPRPTPTRTTPTPQPTPSPSRTCVLIVCT